MTLNTQNPGTPFPSRQICDRAAEPAAWKREKENGKDKTRSKRNSGMPSTAPKTKPPRNFNPSKKAPCDRRNTDSLPPTPRQAAPTSHWSNNQRASRYSRNVRSSGEIGVGYYVGRYPGLCTFSRLIAVLPIQLDCECPRDFMVFFLFLFRSCSVKEGNNAR